MLRKLVLIHIAALVLATAVLSRTIPCLSGFVRDNTGAAVPGVDLDFIDVVTGEKLITPGDNTDISGFYNVCVLPGLYDVTFAPPVGTRLMGRLVPAVDLTANIGVELDVVLLPGTVVTGVVTDASTSLPIAGVDLDVDRVEGGRVFTPDDNTDAVGAYRAVIPNGMFRFRFEPLPGSRVRGVVIDSVVVAGDRTLDVQLPVGMLLEGRVSDDQGAVVPGVDVELREWATGNKVFVANNTTDEGGDYVVAVPMGTFQLRYQPLRGVPLVAAAVDSFVITGDTRRDQMLAQGNLVHFIVRGPSGAPLANADIDVKLPLGGAKLFTPYDQTDAAGTADAVVPDGTYQIVVSPPPGTVLDRVVLRGVPVSRDTTITVSLPEATRVILSGRVVDPVGVGVSGVVLSARITGGSDDVAVTDPLTDIAGVFASGVPMGTLDLRFAPPPGSRFVGLEIPAVSVAGDSSVGDVALEEGFRVQMHVRGPSGTAVAGAKVDFAPGGSSQPVFTPHNTTDASGDALVALTASVYDITVTPLDGSLYAPTTRRSVSVDADTSVDIVMSTRTGVVPGGFQLGQNYPNPFNARTTIPYDIEVETDATVGIYNVAGQLVHTLRSGRHPADSYQVTWDGTDQSGRIVAAGVYFVNLETGLGRRTRKLLLVR